MLFFGIVAIVIFVMAMISLCWCDGEDVVPSIFISLLITLLGTLLALALSLVCTIIPLECGAQLEPAVQTRTELVALQDSSSTLLRRSYSDSTMYYNYMYAKEGKGITMSSVRASHSYIQYVSANQKPYMIKTIYQFKNPVLRFVCIDSLVNPEYEFHLPRGSIVAEGTYEIDLK